MYYVYILLCNDNTYYTGCTEDLKARFERHSKGYVDSTMDNLPVKLVYYCAFDDKYKAYRFEKYLKSGSGGALGSFLFNVPPSLKLRRTKSNPSLTALKSRNYYCGFLFSK